MRSAALLSIFPGKDIHNPNMNGGDTVIASGSVEISTVNSMFHRSRPSDACTGLAKDACTGL
jgi:hypothetical protein